jgi:hypothetical protein
MIFPLTICLVLPILSAFLFMSLYAPARCTNNFPFLLRVFLSIGVGLGIFSCVDFLCLLLYGLSQNSLLLTEFFIVTIPVIGIFLKKRYRARSGIGTNQNSHNELCDKSFVGHGGLQVNLRKVFRCQSTYVSNESKTYIHISAAFFLILLLSLIAYILFVKINPHGQWDAFAIWNLKARFIFRSGIDWERLFSSHIDWSHPDYPLLLPLAIVRLWAYFGKEMEIVPPLIGGIFLFGTVGLLVTGIASFRDMSQGYLGGMALLGIPVFLETGTFLYADIPFAFFLLATIILHHIYETSAKKPT